MTESINLRDLFAPDLEEPITWDGVKSAARYMHDTIKTGKLPEGEYMTFLLNTLNNIANGRKPDTVFKYRKLSSTKSYKKPTIIRAIQEIYDRNKEGKKVVVTIHAVSKEYGFSYEKLREEWYKNDCAWKKSFDEYYNDMQEFYEEKQIQSKS